DRDDERGEVAVADDASKLPFGFEHAGGGPAQRHLAGRPALDVALGAADDLEHRLAGVCRLQRALEVAGNAEPRERQCLFDAFAPSITNRIPCSGSRPRSTRSESSAVATVAFSVEPCQSPSGILAPSLVIPSATLLVRPCSSSPSSINTARRTSASLRLISSV